MTEKRKIYVASSWRNAEQPHIVRQLRDAGHAVYDFRNPSPGDVGFSWSEADSDWFKWDMEQFRSGLEHPAAQRGFKNDWDAMEWADTCVMVLPCGRSAHIEAGYFVGAGKRLIILLSVGNEPELMYKMTPYICVNMAEVFGVLALPDAGMSQHDRAAEMEALLASAHCIALREGSGTSWRRFAASIQRLGIGPITARTYRKLQDE